MYYNPHRCRAKTSKNKICKLKPQAGSYMCFIHRHMIIPEEYDGADYEMPITTTLTTDDIDYDIRQMIKSGLIDRIELEDIVVKCSCCFDQCDMKYVVLCHDSKEKDYEDQHITCYECMKQYMENIIQEKKQIKCISQKCSSNYNEIDIIPALNELCDSYKDYKLIDDVARLASLLDNYHMCPFCLKYGVIIDNTPYDNINNIKNVECGYEKCKKKWCITCRKEEHGDDPCNKIHTTNKDDIRKIIDELIDKALIHTCPKCYTKYDKIDGCNNMLCNACGSHSCYICGILLTPLEGYGHFRQGSCTMYNTLNAANDLIVTQGNIDFNNKRVIKELKNFVNVNKDDPNVLNVILDNIIVRGYPKNAFVDDIKPVAKSIKSIKTIKSIKSTKSKKTKKPKQRPFRMQLRGRPRPQPYISDSSSSDDSSDSSDSSSSESDDIYIIEDGSSDSDSDNANEYNNMVREIVAHNNIRERNRTEPILQKVAARGRPRVTARVIPKVTTRVTRSKTHLNN